MFIGSYNMPTHEKKRKYISKILNIIYKIQLTHNTKTTGKYYWP